MLLADAFAQAVNDFRRCNAADVCHNQRFFKLIVQIIVKFFKNAEHVINFFVKGITRFPEPCL